MGDGQALPGAPRPDGGAVDPALAGALASGVRAQVLAALVDARVFAGISAASTAEEVTEHGLRAESSAEMAVLLLEAGGARALPVFSSVDALARWRLDARPVPLTGAQACRAVLDEGAEALVLDPAGAAVTLSDAEVRVLAAGYVPVVGSSLGSRRAEVQLGDPREPPPARLVAALAEALRPEGLRAARLLEGPDGLVVGVTARGPLGPARLAALAQRLVARLGDELPAEGLDVAEVPPRGAGVPLVRRGLRRGR